MGCASGRGTSPVPIAPEIGRLKYGIRFLDRIDSQRYVGVMPQPQGMGEIGDKLFLQPLLLRHHSAV